MSHEEEWNYCIEELDAWSGYLKDDKMYRMDEIDELLCDRTVSDILSMIHGDFNYRDNYFYFDGLEYLRSTNFLDYNDYLDSDAIEAMVEAWSHLYITERDIDEKALKWFNQLVEDEEEGEEEEENED